MSSSFAVLGVCAIAAVLLFARINVAYLLAATALTSALGMILLAARDLIDASFAVTYSICAALFFVGYLLPRGSGRTLTPSPADQDAFHRRRRRAGVNAVVWFAGCLSVYHLVVGGIPLFSDSIETARFDFTSSGFFGIPGRMYLYGTPIAWVLACCAARADGTAWHKYRPWIYATAFLTLTSVLSGFKSGIAAMLTLVLMMLAYVGRREITLWSLAFRHWWAVALAGAYALVVGLTYNTYRTAGVPIWEVFIDRLTIVGAEPKAIALSGHVYGYFGNPLVADFRYFVSKYSGQAIDGMFSFERAVSAQIIGADPSSGAWTTPVTVGGIAESVYGLGPIGAAIAMLCIGYLVGRVHQSYPPFSGTVFGAIFLYGFYLWFTKGGFAYYTINFAAVSALLAVPYFGVIMTRARTVGEPATGSVRRRKVTGRLGLASSPGLGEPVA